MIQVKTFCKTCLQDKKDSTNKIGRAFIVQINDDAYFCTFLFEKCGHRRTAILTNKQIEAMRLP